MITLDHEVWQRREAEHVERAQRLTQARRERTAQGRTHAVDDFIDDWRSVYGTTTLP